MVSRHCIHCGSLLTGSRFCINCGAMADDSANPSRDGHTVVAQPIASRPRVSTGFVFAVAVPVVVAGVFAGAYFWRQQAAATGVAEPAAQSAASAAGSAESPTNSTRSASSGQSAIPPPDAMEPSDSASADSSRGTVAKLVVSAVSATCNGEAGFDSEGNEVTLLETALVDGRSDTTWRCTYREDLNDIRWDPAKNRAVGESVDFYFSEPVEVVAARFLPGYTKIDASTATNWYAENGRPVLVEWRFGDSTVRQQVSPKSAESRPVCKPVGDVCVLGAGWWSDEVRNPDPSTPVERVTLTILAVEPGNEPQLMNSAAISEVELLGFQ